MWSASKDGTICVWEVATRKHKKSLTMDSDVLSLAEAGDFVWSGTRRSVHIWTKNDLKQVKEIPIGGPVHSLLCIGKLMWLGSS